MATDACRESRMVLGSCHLLRSAGFRRFFAPPSSIARSHDGMCGGKEQRNRWKREWRVEIVRLKVKVLLMTAAMWLIYCSRTARVITSRCLPSRHGSARRYHPLVRASSAPDRVFLRTAAPRVACDRFIRFFWSRVLAPT